MPESQPPVGQLPKEPPEPLQQAGIDARTDANQSGARATNRLPSITLKSNVPTTARSARMPLDMPEGVGVGWDSLGWSLIVYRSKIFLMECTVA